jgi:hypothetical protein
MIGPYTALEAAGLGVIVLGEPEDVQELLDCAHDTGQSAALMTDAGLVAVDAAIDWRLTLVWRGDG